MIHELAIWKLVLGGFIVASLSFLLGFLIAAFCAASGKASREEERQEEIMREELNRKGDMR